MSALPSLDKTFSLVLQEEWKREAWELVMPTSEPSALIAYHNTSPRKEKSIVTYNHYEMSGHNKEKCFRL